MLNEAMDEVVLVKGWKKGANWSFPRGKINKDEKDLDCAIREVYEETGFDIRAAGLDAKDTDVKFIEVTMREQHMRLYVFRGVPYHTHFEPRTRKEISKIQWYKLSELPTLKKNKNHQEGHGEDLAINANKFYMVAPFLVPLKKWIAQQSKRDVLKGSYENQLAPTAVPQEPETVETPVFEKSSSEPPTTDDMGRLMASLRQSGQVPGSGNLPGMPQLNGFRDDAAAQLKGLLRLPQTDSTPAPTVPKTATADEEKSNALLALLRGGNKYRQSNAVQPPPQPPPPTPLEQTSVAAPVPKAPSHHSTQPPRFSEMPVPPSFLLSGPPARGPDVHSEQPAFSLNRHPNAESQQPIRVSQSAMRETGRYPLTAPQPQRQQYVTSTACGGGHAASLPSATQARHQAPAPYRRTGDPEFVQAPQNINNLPPSIPPASRLPAPKLTTHSSALLDIFRTGKASEQSTEVKPAELPQSPTPASLPTAPRTVRESGKTQASQTTAADVLRHVESEGEALRTAKTPLNLPQRSNFSILSASPPSLPYPSQDAEKIVGRNLELGQDSNNAHSVEVQNEASVLRTQHQDALLNLFRKPSVSVADIPSMQSTTLDPPFAPIELSAMPSPSHSREPSQVSNSVPALYPQQSNDSGQITMSKRPVAKQKRNKAPVSATVTGPLNLPQFEVTGKRTKESKPVNGSLKKPGVLNGVQASPITILSRPTSAQRPAPQAQPIPAAPAARTSGIPAPVSSVAAKSVAENKEASKPFQPQILRRPPQPQPPPQPIPYEATAGRLSPPPAQPLPTEIVAGGSTSPALPPPPHDQLFSDRRNSRPQEHKQALLSLFNAPSPVSSLSKSAHTVVVGPLSNRTALGEYLASAFPEPSRSRIDSRTPTIGDGSGRLSSGKQTARTTPVDKRFLLGYLEGVAKGDRR